MVSDFFDTLLQEIGEAMEIDDLHLDASNTCLIRFKSGIEIYLEPYEKDQFLLIFCDLGNVPAGRFREDVFREALKSNGLPYPHNGTFAYSEQSDHLLLYSLLSYRELNGEKVASHLYPFIEKAKTWKETIERGSVPVADTTTTGRRIGPGGIFGLHQ